MSEPDQPDEKYPSAPTRLDDTASGSNTLQTRLDVPHLHTQSAHTVRDDAVFTQGSLIQLPSALRNRYRILNQLRNYGAEADLLLVEPNNNEESGNRVIKLYRRGIQPKEDVLAKVMDGCPDHLVRIYDFGQSDGHWYEVLEFIEHGSLRQLLRDRPMPETYLREILRELTAGIEHLHSYGIIHRDLKPENILVREQIPLDLVIIDFGISSLTEMSQRFTSASRTVRYAAPEAIGGEISRASDYWSLGIILVEACLGRHPFSDLSDERAVMSWLATRSVDLSGITNARWQNLFRGLLQRNPKSRWGAVEISRWLEGDTTLIAPVEQTELVPSTTAIGEFRADMPYEVIRGEQCWTGEQLGVALAKNWDTAIRDLARGELRNWCVKELNSLPTRRLFIDLEESTKGPDDKLLQLILYLCPTIPPCYAGISLASKGDLAGLIEQARKSSESRESVKAREVIGKIVDENLLGKFELTKLPELQEVNRRLFLLSERRRSLLNSSLRNRFPDYVFGAVPWPSDAESRANESLSIVALAIAINSNEANNLVARAKSFADGLSIKLWFDENLLTLITEETLASALDLHVLTAVAQPWFETLEGVLFGEQISRHSDLVASILKLANHDLSTAIQLANGIKLGLIDSIPHTLKRLADVLHIDFKERAWVGKVIAEFVACINGACSHAPSDLQNAIDVLRETEKLANELTKLSQRIEQCGSSEYIRLYPNVHELIVHAIQSPTPLKAIHDLGKVAEEDNRSLVWAGGWFSMNPTHRELLMWGFVIAIGIPFLAVVILRKSINEVMVWAPLFVLFLCMYMAAIPKYFSISSKGVVDQIMPGLYRAGLIPWQCIDKVSVETVKSAIQVLGAQNSIVLHLRDPEQYLRSQNVLRRFYYQKIDPQFKSNRLAIHVGCLPRTLSTAIVIEKIQSYLQTTHQIPSAIESSSALKQGQPRITRWKLPMVVIIVSVAAVAIILGVKHKDELTLREENNTISAKSALKENEAAEQKKRLAVEERERFEQEERALIAARDKAEEEEKARLIIEKNNRQLEALAVTLARHDAANPNIKTGASELELGKRYLVEAKYPEAFQSFHKSALQDNPAGQRVIGFMYAKGLVVSRDNKEAAHWYRKAAERGDARAQVNLGLSFADGLGVQRDEAEAIRWFRKAEEQGEARAQVALAMMYLQGRGVTHDDAEAVRRFRVAAEKGDALAQYNLGLMYEKGNIVPQNDSEALRWYRMSAENGFADAQVNLGSMYADGRGVTRNDADAVRWYRKAAEQGDPDAQTNLGRHYENGVAVPQDYAESIRWYRKAALQGHSGGQYDLGFMYMDGRGVPSDDSEAIRWFRKAAEQGHADAKKALDILSRQIARKDKKRSIDK